MSIAGFQAGQESVRAGRSFKGLALGSGSRRSPLVAGLMAGTAAATLCMFLPSTALANCVEAGGQISCTGPTPAAAPFTVNVPNSQVDVNSPTTFTGGGLKVDNSGTAGNKIDFYTYEVKGTAASWNYVTNDHAVQLISGLDGEVSVHTVAGTTINLTGGGSSTDGLRLRTGTGANPAANLGKGTINVDLVGTNINTAGKSEGVDAGAGSGGITINVSSGKNSQGTAFAGDITSAKSHAISATAGNGGDVEISILKNDAGTPTITGGTDGIYAHASDNAASSGDVTVTNYGHVEGKNGAGVNLFADSGTVTLKKPQLPLDDRFRLGLIPARFQPGDRRQPSGLDRRSGRRRRRDR